MSGLPVTAFAQGTFSDPASGFGIAPPAPFVAEATSRRQFDVGVGVKSTTGKPAPAGTAPYVCEAGFKAAPQNNSLSRAEINAQMDKPEWANLIRATIELAFNVTAQQRFTLQGFRGVELRGSPKAGPGHENARMFMSMVETPKGRVTMVCVTERNGFERALRSSARSAPLSDCRSERHGHALQDPLRLSPRGQRILVRVDLNVPVENGRVSDATRLDRILPTIRELSDAGGRVILLAHFGRPKGRDPKESLEPVAKELSGRLGKPLAFAPDCIGPEAEAAVAKLRDGEVLCLENTRFHKEEEKNDPAFVAALAKLGDAYVNDAFSPPTGRMLDRGLARSFPPTPAAPWRRSSRRSTRRWELPTGR